jgi:hypothetical protein
MNLRPTRTLDHSRIPSSSAGVCCLVGISARAWLPPSRPPTQVRGPRRRPSKRLRVPSGIGPTVLSSCGFGRVLSAQGLYSNRRRAKLRHSETCRWPAGVASAMWENEEQHYRRIRNCDQDRAEDYVADALKEERPAHVGSTAANEPRRCRAIRNNATSRG